MDTKPSSIDQLLKEYIKLNKQIMFDKNQTKEEQKKAYDKVKNYMDWMITLYK